MVVVSCFKRIQGMWQDPLRHGRGPPGRPGTAASYFDDKGLDTSFDGRQALAASLRRLFLRERRSGDSQNKASYSMLSQPVSDGEPMIGLTYAIRSVAHGELSSEEGGTDKQGR